MYRSRKLTKAYNPNAQEKLHKVDPNACPFCDPSTIAIEKQAEHIMVVRNLFPYQYWEFLDVSDHLMLVPKRHVTSLQQFTDEEKIEFVQMLADYEALGYNVYARAPGSTMKTIPHQHTHLIKTENKRAKAVVFFDKPYFVWKI